MKMPFRLYRRGKTYYAQNNDTGEQVSLRTKDKATATRLLNAKNESTMLMGSNLLVARAYMVATDPEMPKRTWKHVIDFIIDEKPETARHRWTSVKKDKALARLWKLRVVETRAEQFIIMLKKGTVSTNTYLRRLHNYALDMNWLPWPILPKKRWPKIVYGEKRGITLEEHRRIIEAEAEAARRNQGSRTGDQPHYNERRDYYELLWFTGGSQSDIAALHAEDIDLKDQTIHYRRKKSGSDAMPRFGKGAAAVLARRPKTGPLFPYLITCDCKDRATEFKQRCDGLGIKGISLHSYRYGWAERARKAGYPRRYAEEALGHNSKAVHAAYASKAVVTVPSLEEYEEANLKKKVMPVEFQSTEAPKCKKRRLGTSANGSQRRVASRPNEVWSYDFVSDQTRDGRRLKFLCVVDEFTRECLALEVGRRFRANDVIAVLAGLIARRGIPAHLDEFDTMENGRKPDFLRQLKITDLFVPYIDNKLRNGIGHHSAHYDVQSDTIKYRSENKSGIQEFQISYMEFCTKIVHLYRQLHFVSKYAHWLRQSALTGRKRCMANRKAAQMTSSTNDCLVNWSWKALR